MDTQRIEYKGQRMLTEMFQILNLIQSVYYREILQIVGVMPLKKGRSGLFAIILQACRMRTPCGYINNFDLRANPIELMGFFMQTDRIVRLIFTEFFMGQLWH